MTAPDNSPDDLESGRNLRKLAHDLSNALEIIVQSSFLVGTLDLGENGKQWHQLLEGGIARATAINRQLSAAIREETREDRSDLR